MKKRSLSRCAACEVLQPDKGFKFIRDTLQSKDNGVGSMGVCPKCVKIIRTLKKQTIREFRKRFVNY